MFIFQIIESNDATFMEEFIWILYVLVALMGKLLSDSFLAIHHYSRESNLRAFSGGLPITASTPEMMMGLSIKMG